MAIAIEDNSICRRCQARCVDAITRSYVGDVLVDISCESCAEFRRIEQYRRDSVLRTKLILSAALWGYERSSASHGALEDWRWELMTLRSAPPLMVPEERWTDYRMRIRRIANELPDRDSRAMPKFVEHLVRESKKKALQAEQEFGVYDGRGYPIEQPRSYRAVNASYETINALVKGSYEPLVWFGGLQKFVRSEPVKGHSVEMHGIKLLSYCMAGRAMQTISIESGESITLITAEDEAEPRMGIQGIEATEQQAVDMLRRCIELWQSGVLKMLRRDGEVSVF